MRRHYRDNWTDDEQKRQAFEDLYDSTFDQVLRYCRRRSLRPEDAEDAAVETYLIAWRKLNEVLEADSPRAWLFGVAFRVTANQRRGRDRFSELIQRLAMLPRRAAGNSAETVFLTKASADEVHAALRTLNSVEQELIRLSAFEELPYVEIGAVLGLSPAAVRTRLYRARLRLLSRLGQDLPRDCDQHPDTSGSTGSVKPAPSAGEVSSEPNAIDRQACEGEEQ